MNIYDTLKTHWLVACLSSKLKNKPLRVEILNTPLVLFRSRGKIAALLDRCPHRGVPLSKGKLKGNNIQCCYHGWEFDSNGVCQHIPGLCREQYDTTQHIATRFTAKETQGLIWIKLEQSNSAIPNACELPNDQPSDQLHMQYTFESDLLETMENFLDGTHTHFIHKNFLSIDTNRQPTKALIYESKAQVCIKYLYPDQPRGLVYSLFQNNLTSVTARYIYPNIVQLAYEKNNETIALFTGFVSPVNSNSLMSYIVISVPKNRIVNKIKSILFKLFLKRVLKQDRTILRLQQENLACFKDKKLALSPLDLIRPYIIRSWHGQLKDVPEPKEIKLFV